MYISELQTAVVKLFYCLCNFHSPEFLSALSDWDDFLRILMDQRLFLPAYRKIRQFIPNNIRRTYDVTYLCFLQKNKIFVAEAKKMVKLAHDAHLEPLIIKGIAFAYYIYGNVDERQFGDIDIVVREDKMPKMDGVLREAGYLQYYIDKLTGFKCVLDRPLMRSIWNHEYFGYEKEINGIQIDAEIAKQLHSSVTGKLMEEFIQHSSIVMFDGANIPTFDLYHTLLCMVENIYENSRVFYKPHFMRLSNYLDLHLFLVIYFCLIDTCQLKQLISKYGMSHIFAVVMNDICNLLKNNKEAIVFKFANQLDISISLEEQNPVLERIFNNANTASIRHYVISTEKIFGGENPYYSAPYSGDSFSVACEDGITFNISIQCKPTGLRVGVTSEWESTEYRICFRIYNNVFMYRLNEISLCKKGLNLQCYINNMYCVNYTEKETAMQSLAVDHNEFNESSGVDEHSMWLTVEYSRLKWERENKPGVIGLGLYIEKKLGDGIYQKFYNIGKLPTPYILYI